MNVERPKYCRTCGASLPAEGDFCESCGSLVVTGPTEEPEPTRAEPVEDQEEVEVEVELPDPSVPPRVGSALSIGWQILSQDIVGGVLVALVYFLITMVVGVIPFVSIFSFLVLIPLQVGFLGWAEARRNGKSAGVNTMIRIALNRFADAVLLALVMFAIALVFIIPAFLIYLSLVGVIAFSAATYGAAPSPGALLPALSIAPPLMALLIAWIALGGLILGPVIQSLMSLACWAISQGKPFKESFGWAWERIKRNFFGWWWAGIVINFISGIGVLACYIGILATVPWGMLAWAEAAGYRGEEE